VVTFMDGQLFAETAENDAKHRPVITSSPTEARETDSKWKVAGFVTRMTPRHHPSNIHSSRFARERERERPSRCCLENHPLSYGATILYVYIMK
jgi:hypothetical protein